MSRQRRMPVWVVVVCAALGWPRPGALATELPSDDFAVVGALVFDGAVFLEDADVWVEAGRVREVGNGLALPEGLPRVEGSGRTVLPGLIDAHVHAFAPTSRSDALRFGVTTLLDQFAHPSPLASARQERETLGVGLGADLYSSGFLATTPGGHGTEYGMAVPTLERPEEATAWVEARAGEGSDWIKIVYDDGSLYGIENWTTLDRDTMAALVEAAHERELIAVVHVARLADALDALDAGADGLVHVWSDEVVDAAVAARFAESEMWVTPTLAVNLAVAGDAGQLALLDSAAAPRLSAAQRSALGGRFPQRETSRASARASLDSVRRLHAAGVRLLAGTDAPNPGMAFGIGLHREIELLAGAGLDPAAALAAATSAPADAYQLTDRGRLEPGRLADLLLVEGDVREGLAAPLAVAAVWKDGASVALDLGVGSESPSESEDARVLGAFDSESAQGWSPTTDAMMGGASTVELAVEEGVLTVRGEVRPGFMFPWAGAAVGFASGTADLSEFAELRFRVQGDGQDGRVMLIVAGSAGPPPTVPFRATTEWQERAVPLGDFVGANLKQVQAIVFVAGPAPGPFAFRLDDVELR